MLTTAVRLTHPGWLTDVPSTEALTRSTAWTTSDATANITLKI